MSTGADRREILLCCTFREFDGGPNDDVQHAFLESVARQGHPDLRLVVTNFRERNVRRELDRHGVRYVFRQSPLDVQISLSEMLAHAADEVTPGKSIFVYTNVDHLFPADFFLDLERHFEPGSSGTWFPQIIYASRADLEAGRPLYHPQATPTSPRVPFPYRDPNLRGWLQVDPNRWLPDTVFIDGDLLAAPATRDRIGRLRFDAFWPGQAQSVILGFMGAPHLRKNLVFSRQYAELLNVYGESLEADAKIHYNKLREEEFARVPELYRTMWAWAAESGIPESSYRERDLDKLRQVSQYRVVGDVAQRRLFRRYLEYWRTRYQTAETPDQGAAALAPIAADLVKLWDAVYPATATGSPSSPTRPGPASGTPPRDRGSAGTAAPWTRRSIPGAGFVRRRHDRPPRARAQAPGPPCGAPDHPGSHSPPAPAPTGRSDLGRSTKTPGARRPGSTAGRGRDTHPPIERRTLPSLPPPWRQLERTPGSAWRRGEPTAHRWDPACPRSGRRCGCPRG